MLNPEPLIARNEAELSDEGSERAVLASLMAQPTFMVECSTRLKPEDFVNKNNSYLYQIMLSIFKGSNGKPYTFDTASLMSLAIKSGAEKAFIEKSGGDQYIEFLNIIKTTMISPEAFEGYMARVYDFSIKRKLLRRNRELETGIFEGSKSPEELMIHGQRRIEGLFLELTSKSRDFVNLGLKAGDFIENALKYQKTILGIPTLFPQLDKTIEGLRNGALYVICAPKKTGKTAMLVNVGVNVGIKQNIPTLMISTEMSDEEIMSRIISNLSNVDQKRIEKGLLDDVQKKAVKLAQSRFEAGQFFHITIRQFTVENIIGVVRKFVNNVVGFKEDGKPKQCLIIFDYLKMPQDSTSKDSKEYKVLGELTNSLKSLAGDLDVPALTACQTNRAGGIANSYEITWYCDVFMELARKTDSEMAEEMSAGPYQGNQKLKITANRSGEENHQGIDFEFHGPTLKYNEMKPLVHS